MLHREPLLVQPQMHQLVRQAERKLEHSDICPPSCRSVDVAPLLPVFSSPMRTAASSSEKSSPSSNCGLMTYPARLVDVAVLHRQGNCGLNAIAKPICM